MYKIGHIQGLAAFDVGGFHFLTTSYAMQRVVDVGVRDDIDGNSKPEPVGTAPELGVDENSTQRIFHPFVPLFRRQ